MNSFNSNNTNSNTNLNNTSDTDNNNNNNNKANNSVNVFNKKEVNDERYIFGNFFGVVSDKYIKYFNLFALHLLCTVFFGLIYYALLLDFDHNFYIPVGFPKSQFLDNLFVIAIFLSIQFETTTAYVDLKCKSFFSRLIFNIQTITTFLITFLFLIV
jgi:hypothetical protein